MTDSSTARVLAAAEKIRRDGVPAEAAELVATLLEAHRQMHIGPAEEGGWPRGWIAVDHAQTKLADKILEAG